MQGYDETTLFKLAALAGMTGVQVAEVIGIFWPSPTGTIYYATRQLDLVTPGIPVSPIKAKLIPENLDSAEVFQTVTSESSISDEEIELNFFDADGAIADLAYLHGEGVRVEVFYWFPQVELLLSQWWGHLGMPKDSDSEFFKASAAVGFRSPLLPMPRGSFQDSCPYTWGGLLLTLEQILDNDCPWNLLAGGTIGVPGSELLPPCPRTSRTVCTQYLGDSRSFGGYETPVQTILINQTQGPAINFSSKGNTSNLKQPPRVIFGHRIVRELDLISYTPTTNTNHPELGFVQVLFFVANHRIQSMSLCAVNNLLIANEHLNIRLGARRQSPTSYSSTVPNYSHRAHFYANYGQVNAAQYNANNLKGQCTVDGNNDIRVYTDSETYTVAYTANRAWCLLEMRRNTLWGEGLDVSRFVIQDWIDLAEWCAEHPVYTDPDGNEWGGIRSEFHADMQGRTSQQQIADVCMAGHFSKPFSFLGKERIIALKKEENLDAVPVFTDYGTNKNICVDENGKTSLRHSRTSDRELPNQIKLTFEDAARYNTERPLSFEDKPQQLRAGRAFGDESIRVVEKSYSALGVTSISEAVRMGFQLLHLGPFDEGGTKNNLETTFTTFYSQTLELHPFKVIKVLSHQLDRYGFEYFRIKSLKRLPNLKVEIVAQAYPDAYYEALEATGAPFVLQYEAEDEDNTLTGDAEVQSDASCSGGAKVVGLGGKELTVYHALVFNEIVIASSGLYDVSIYYKSEEDLVGYVNINGGAASPVDFPSSGGAVASVTISRTLPVSATNTIRFFHPTDPIPDLDGLIIERHVIEPIDPPGGGGGGGVCRPSFGDITYEEGRIIILTLPCD